VSFVALVRELFQGLRQSPALAATIFGGVALHWGVAAAAFDQLWFVRERGFSAAEIAQLNGYAIVIGGIAGNLLGGWLGDLWQARMKSGRAMLLFWMFLAVSPLTIAYRLVPPDSSFFWIGMFAGIFLLSAFYGPAFASVQELAPKRIRGTMTGFFILAVNVFGLGVGITVAGVLIDSFRAAGVEQPYTMAALTCGMASLLAIPAFYLAGLWFNRDLPVNKEAVS
jgi:MFS family permease